MVMWSFIPMRCEIDLVLFFLLPNLQFPNKTKQNKHTLNIFLYDAYGT